MEARRAAVVVDIVVGDERRSRAFLYPPADPLRLLQRRSSGLPRARRDQAMRERTRARWMRNPRPEWLSRPARTRSAQIGYLSARKEICATHREKIWDFFLALCTLNLYPVTHWYYWHSLHTPVECKVKKNRSFISQCFKNTPSKSDELEVFACLKIALPM